LEIREAASSFLRGILGEGVTRFTIKYKELEKAASDIIVEYDYSVHEIKFIL